MEKEACSLKHTQGHRSYDKWKAPRILQKDDKCPISTIDLTEHGPTGTPIEGSNAHIFDDDGKDRRVAWLSAIYQVAA